MDLSHLPEQDALEATQRPGGCGVPAKLGVCDATLASIEGGSTEGQKMVIARVFLG